MPSTSKAHQQSGIRHNVKRRKKRLRPAAPQRLQTRKRPAMAGEYTARMNSGLV